MTRSQQYDLEVGLDDSIDNFIVVRFFDDVARRMSRLAYKVLCNEIHRTDPIKQPRILGEYRPARAGQEIRA